MSDGFQSNETGKTRFDQAIERIDAVNKTDPRVETAGGRSEPRELAFARRVTDWVRRLADDPSEALLLAARGHTVGRWRIPRDRYPATTLGYHEWRDALARMHAEETARICREAGYGEDVIRRVSELITRKRFPDDAEARVLEDADCLVFLETKLAGYVDEWGEKKRCVF